MKKYFISCFVFFNLVTSSLVAQSFDWAFKSAGYNAGFGGDMTTDNSGNILVTGAITNSCDFDPDTGTFNLANSTGSSNSDVFIAKYTPQGNFINAIVLGGKKVDFEGAINVDQNNNVIVTGCFRDTVDFDPGPGLYILTADFFYGTGFILKLDSNLNFIWAKALEAINPTYYPIGRFWNALDNEGNIYLTGVFHGTVDFNPGIAIDTITSTQHDEFILKLDSAGNFVWVKVVRGVMGPQAIETDSIGNLYIAGWFLGTIDFDPDPGIYNLSMDSNTVGNGISDAFVSKYDSAGNFAWAKRAGGKNSDQFTLLHLVNNQSVLVGGWFQDTANVDPGVSNYSLHTDTSDMNDSFILNLDSAGNFNWVKQFVTNAYGSFYGRGNFVTDLTSDANGNIFVFNYFFGRSTDTIDFDPGINSYYVPVTTASTFTCGNLGVIKLNSSGGFISGVKIADTTGSCESSKIISDAAGQITVLGKLRKTIDFDPGSSYYALTSDSGVNYNYFLLSLNYNTTGTTQQLQQPNNLLLFPNPSSNKITIVSNKKENITITNILGEVVLEKNFPINTKSKIELDVSSLTPGIYFVRVGDKVEKFIKQ